MRLASGMKCLDRYASVMGYILVMLALALGDELNGIYFSFWALYFVPIGFATWNFGVRTGSAFAVLAVALLFVTELYLGLPNLNLMDMAWSYCSTAIAYAALVFLVSALRKKEIARVYVPPDKQ